MGVTPQVTYTGIRTNVSTFDDVADALGYLDTYLSNLAIDLVTVNITDNSITYAKMQDQATQTFLGRNTAGSGDPEALSIATALTMLSLGSAISGPGLSTANAISIWSGTSGDTLLDTTITITSNNDLGGIDALTMTGDLVVDTPTLFVSSSANRVSIGTLSQLALFHIEASSATEMLIRESTGGSLTQIIQSNPDFTISLNSTGVTDFTIKGTTGVIELPGELSLGASTTSRPSLNIPHGTAPTSPDNGDVWTATTGIFARINGATKNISGGVTGPGSSTDNAIALWDGTGGDTLKDSNIRIISDDMTGGRDLTITRDLLVSSPLFFVDNSAGRVSIGTLSNLALFHIEAASNTEMLIRETTGGSLTQIIQGNPDFTISLNSTGVTDFKIKGTTGVIEIGKELIIQAPAAAAGLLTLTTGELTVVSGDILGQFDFQAPLESNGTDAILVAASIRAEATAEFTASVNSTALIFATGTTSTPIDRVWIDEIGSVGVGTASPGIAGDGSTQLTGKILDVLNASGIARLTVHSNTAAILDLIDTGGTANNKHCLLATLADTTRFDLINDDGTTKTTGVISIAHSDATVSFVADVAIAGDLALRTTILTANANGVGVNTTPPASAAYIMHVAENILVTSATNPGIYLSEGNTANVTVLEDVNTFTARLKKVTANAATIDFDPFPGDNTSTAAFRICRSTNTTGTVHMEFYIGANSGTRNAVIGMADVDTYFCNDNGTFIVGGNSATNSMFTLEGTISMKEQAAADADTAAYGQLWVKDDTPNKLFFTDDAGTDHEIAFV